MKAALSRLACCIGLIVALGALRAMAQEEIPFESEPKAESKAAPATTEPQPNPFVPEETKQHRAAKDETAPMPSQVVMPPATSLFRGGEECESPVCVPSLGCGCACAAACEESPRVGAMLFSGVECWRNISDGPLTNNAGAVIGGNLGFPLPVLGRFGIGGQLGLSYGAFDLDGRFSADDQSPVQQQTFITAGLFRRACGGSRISAGIAYDWMINDEYGFLATHPFLGQWRAQVGYALNPCNELGVWGTLKDRGDSAFDGELPFRPVSQVNLFWHHNFDSGADSWLWIGAPEREKLGGEGRLGEFTLGATLYVPLTERVAVYANGQYMRPTARAGLDAAIENSYTVGFGLAFYPCGKAKNASVAGKCWMPYLPVANNGNFLVDSMRVLF
jgi:hypothetical protein